jgi:hypothetical protein
MSLSEHFQKQLAKKHPPSTMVETTYKGNDVAFRTDENGDAVLLFIGKRDERSGLIRGERYARRLKKDQNGAVIKDHWELKGKATP